MRDEDAGNTAELKTTLTREEMHQLVWSVPMNILAERHLVLGVARLGRAWHRLCPGMDA
jgi:hypothetical protein